MEFLRICLDGKRRGGENGKRQIGECDEANDMAAGRQPNKQPPAGCLTGGSWQEAACYLATRPLGNGQRSRGKGRGGRSLFDPHFGLFLRKEEHSSATRLGGKVKKKRAEG
jgi:hypothetical protein